VGDVFDSSVGPALLARIANGDAEAETSLVQQFGPRILAMVLARTRDRELARDLAQDALIAVLRAARAGQVRDPERLSAFVHGVARNVVSNYLRGNRRRAEDQLVDDVPATVSFEDHFDDRERQALLQQALASLGDADRRILEWTLVEGLTPGDIAGRLGVPADVVRTRKSRALKRVLAAMAGLLRPAGL